ncbi:MAG: hypothetical protein AAFY71_10395 [Bacteroidota bacterium]
MENTPKPYTWLLWIVIVAPFVTSCWSSCLLSYQGIVLDDETGAPLAGVLIRSFEEGAQLAHFTTDSTGKFELEGTSHGTFIGTACNELIIEFSRSGFITFMDSTTNGELSVTVRMKR